MRLGRLTLYLLIIYSLLTFYSVISLLAQLPRTALMTPLLTLLAFFFAVLHAGQRLGWKQAGLLVGLCFGISLLFESVGVATGLVYGPYHYTAMLGPKFLGLVPYLIPLAWFMMMYPSLVIAQALQRKSGPKSSAILSTLGVAAMGGLVMTSWDLTMDPMMVKVGNWVWDGPSAVRPYFGVPLQNYWGWWLTTFVIFGLYFWLASHLQNNPGTAQAADQLGFDRLALYSYMVTGIGTVFTALLIGLDGPALVGLFAMGPWAWLTYHRL